MNLPILQEDIDRWCDGEYIQNVFPQLNADQREFLMTGITPEEWDASMHPPVYNEDAQDR
jgi:hypothetical protein